MLAGAGSLICSGRETLLTRCSSFSFPSPHDWERAGFSLSGLPGLPDALAEYRGQSGTPKENRDKHACVNLAIKWRGLN